MNAFAHQLAKRCIDLPLSLDAAEPGECVTFDDERKMAFAARVVAGMADMLPALILKIEAGRA